MTGNRSIGHLRRTLGFGSPLGTILLRACRARALLHSLLVCSLPNEFPILNRLRFLLKTDCRFNLIMSVSRLF